MFGSSISPMPIWPSNIKQTPSNMPISEEPASDFPSSLPPDYCKTLFIEYLYRQPLHGMVHLLVRYSLCSHTLTRLLRLFEQNLGGSMVIV